MRMLSIPTPPPDLREPSYSHESRLLQERAQRFKKYISEWTLRQLLRSEIEQCNKLANRITEILHEKDLYGSAIGNMFRYDESVREGREIWGEDFKPEDVEKSDDLALDFAKASYWASIFDRWKRELVEMEPSSREKNAPLESPASPPEERDTDEEA